MRIRHILRDGTVLDSIAGRIVRIADAPNTYAILEKINKRKEKHNARRL